MVTAFIAASRRHDNLRSSCARLPDCWDPISEIIYGHPKIEILPDKITDDELLALYCRAEIFLVPSASLHALSVARAMHCGMVCASDAPGFEEYLTDEVTGFLVPGRREMIYSEEPETGWMRDDYLPMFKPNPEYSTRLDASHAPRPIRRPSPPDRPQCAALGERRTSPRQLEQA